jgi:dethiobiotin synthetase
LFITGTDTGVGKTWCSLALMRRWQAQGRRVAGMKPVASGCEMTPAGLRNADAEALLRQSGLALDYALVNPYAFAPPIAPHLAARAAGRRIEIESIVAAYHALRRQADRVLVEGVGGWRVPLNERESLKDLALALDAGVILVVGLRLGCINHALLSAECILHDGCRLHGWIANPLDPDFDPTGSIEAIRERINAPLLELAGLA